MRFLTNGVLAAILSGLFLLNSISAFAHGGGTPRLVNEPVGPYRLFAWSSPEPLRAGEIHITFALILPSDGGRPVDEATLFNELDQVVTGADITVQFISIDGSGGQFETTATPSSINPLYYETDTELPNSGNWQVTVDVAGDLGDGSATFSSVVEEAQLIDWKIVGSVVVALLFLIYAGRVRSTNARKRKALK